MRLSRCGSILATVALLLLAAPAAKAQDRLAFQALGDLWTVHASGAAPPVDITPLTGAHESNPAWSPDAERIAYTAAGHAYVIPAGGGEAHRLVDTEDRVIGVDWARDGRIVYVTEDRAAGTRSIRIADRFGRPRPMVIGTDVGGTRIDVSPDGREVLYDGRDGDLRVAALDGTADRPLAPGVHPSSHGAWSPDGSRIAYEGCGDVVDCGNEDIWVIDADGTHPSQLTSSVLDDSDPAWSSDGLHIAYARAVSEVGVVASVIDATGENDRALGLQPIGVSSLAWEPSTDPIVFIPGFMGSEIDCDGQPLWPAGGTLEQQLLDLRLADDGRANLGATPCGAAAAPSGEVVSAVDEHPLYAATLAFLDRIQPDHRVYAWDWRRSPADALAGLDREVELARCGGRLPAGADTCTRPPHPQVTLYGHGLGGLLARAYVNDPARAAKVSRLLTLGTPYKGAPAALLPLEAGVEPPGVAALDPLLPNGALRDLARNLAGLYALWPTDAYGPWLTAGGRELDRAGVLDHVAQLGGNAALLAAALDAPPDQLQLNGVQYEALAGAGRNTIRSITVGPSGELSFEYGNGDGTVPLGSAERAQEELACGVGHAALASDAAVAERIRRFLLEGDAIAPGGSGACPAGGFQIDYRIVAGQERGDSNLDELEEGDRIKRLDLGSRQLIVTSERDAVAVKLGAESYTLEVTPIGADGAKGAAMRYGTLSGPATIAAGTELHVLVGGREVLPVKDAPPPPAPPAPAPPGGGGAGPSGPPRATTAARLTGLRLAPARFRALRHGGSVVRRGGAAVLFTLSSAAPVRFAVERRVIGHRAGGRCRAGRPRHGRGCVRFVRAAGSFAFSGLAGSNRLRFSGRLRGRALAPGRYRLVAVVTGESAVRAGFTVQR
jgi:Tol biopolymer transport system component